MGIEVRGVCVGISKGFDKIRHKGRIYKLCKMEYLVDYKYLNSNLWNIKTCIK